MRFLRRYLFRTIVFFPIFLFITLMAGYKMENDLKGEPVYKCALQFVTLNPSIRDAIGGLETVDPIFWERTTPPEPRPVTEKITLRIQGSRARGEVRVNLVYSNTEWEVVSGTLLPLNSSSVIDLTNSPDGSVKIYDVQPRQTWGGLPYLIGAGVVVWLVMIYYIVRMVLLRLPGIPIWDVDVFSSSGLSAQALPYRKRALIAGAVFLILILLAMFL